MKKFILALLIFCTCTLLWRSENAKKFIAFEDFVSCSFLRRLSAYCMRCRESFMNLKCQSYRSSFGLSNLFEASYKEQKAYYNI